MILIVICDPPCQNDAPCVANDTCNCNTGFIGPTCDSKHAVLHTCTYVSFSRVILDSKGCLIFIFLKASL